MANKIFSKKNRMADNGTLAKTLFYDLVCQSRCPAGLSLVDANNCYDRIVHANASLVCQSFGVPQEAIGSMLRMIQEMKFFPAPHMETQTQRQACVWTLKCKDSVRGMVPPPLDGQ
jgi:hypothetical protein